MKLSDEVINSLSLNLREKIKTLKRENIEEIRLRVNKPLIINGDLIDYFYNDKTKKLDKNIAISISSLEIKSSTLILDSLL